MTNQRTGEKRQEWSLMMVRFALERGLPIPLTMPDYGCEGCKDSIALQMFRTDMVAELRKANHEVKLGPSMINNHLILDITCRKCFFTMNGHVDYLWGEPILWIDLYLEEDDDSGRSVHLWF